MDSLETEYSFLAPTWKLPSVGTTSSYPNTFPPPQRMAPEVKSTPNNTMQNSRYMPPNINRQNHQEMNNQHTGGRRSIQPAPPSPLQLSRDQYRHNDYSNGYSDMNEQYNGHQNGYNNGHHNGYSNQQMDNRNGNHTTQPVQKRVQIIDHNRQTPSTDHISGRETHDTISSDSNHVSQKSKSFDNDSHSPRNNKSSIHEYLYGLSAPNPGSYVSAYKNQRRRLGDERYNRKTVLNEYKTFVQNGGFGPAFGNGDFQTYEEKLDTEKKRKDYSKFVREINHLKVEEHKRVQNNGGQQRNRSYVPPVPRLPRPDALKSHLLTAQELGLETPSDQRSNSPVLHQTNFERLHPWNQCDILSGELSGDRSSSYSQLPSIYHIDYIGFLNTNILFRTKYENQAHKLSPENSSKTTSRNVRFLSEIIDDNEQVISPIKNSQLSSSSTTTTKNSISTNNSNDKC